VSESKKRKQRRRPAPRSAGAARSAPPPSGGELAARSPASRSEGGAAVPARASDGRRLRLLVAVTGASGAPYAVALLRRRLGDVWLALSGWGRMVLREETGLREDDLRPLVRGIIADKDLANPFASGSNAFDAMVIVPCSLTTMAKIAAGIGDTAITRAAMVALKERRRLVLVVREAPWPTNAFENAARLSRDGVTIVPASPPFYHRPETLEELIEQFVDKIVGCLGFEPQRKWRPGLLEGAPEAGEVSAEERQALGLPPDEEGGGMPPDPETSGLPPDEEG